jgi:hypothetical protein
MPVTFFDEVTDIAGIEPTREAARGSASRITYEGRCAVRCDVAAGRLTVTADLSV